MLLTKTCGARPQPCTPTVLPLRSRMLRMPSWANSSKQPTWTPAMMVMRSPASILGCRAATKCMVKSTSPRPTPAIEPPVGRTHVLDVGETFRPQELVGDILRCDADAGMFRQADSRGLRRMLSRRMRWADHGRGGGRRQCGEKAPSILNGGPAQVFSSRLSSLKKRQSVPCAMILLGVDLIMPASCSRNE